MIDLSFLNDLFSWLPIFVFFGISFGKTKTVSAPSPVSVWSPEQQAVMRTLAPIIQQGLAGPAPAYPGQLYVPPTPEEEAYFKRVPFLAEELAQMRARLGRPAFEISPETIEQFYRQAIRAPAMREWEQTVLPTIKEAYAGPGWWGSARAQAEAKAAESLATELARQRAQLAYLEEQARRTALSEAAAREATYGLPYATAESQMLGTAGEYARSIAQQKVLADLQRWLMGEEVGGVYAPQYNPFIQLAFELLGLSPYAIGEKTTGRGFEFGLTLPKFGGG